MYFIDWAYMVGGDNWKFSYFTEEKTTVSDQAYRVHQKECYLTTTVGVQLSSSLILINYVHCNGSLAILGGLIWGIYVVAEVSIKHSNKHATSMVGHRFYTDYSMTAFWDVNQVACLLLHRLTTQCVKLMQL